MTIVDADSFHEDSGSPILDDRFALASERRQGGMAWVQKAFDQRSGNLCAIKRLKPLDDEFLAKESFRRELAALESLRHPNIVEMISYGIDDKRRPYIALEWVEDNLEDIIERRTQPMRWDEFWRDIGKPILEAICAAQANHFLHRDIKPKNILIGENGTPKISDYGISVFTGQASGPLLKKLTFREHGSKPYTPPEPDDGKFSYTRDGFSWAILAIYCLTKKEPTDYGIIPALIDGLSDAPVEILQSAASLEPPNRPEFANLLLNDLLNWEQQQESNSDRPINCSLIFGPYALNQISTILGPDTPDPVVVLLSDFLGSIGVRPVPDESSRLRLTGDTWQLIVHRSENRPTVLFVERAFFIGPSEAERQRDLYFQSQFNFMQGTPLDESQAALELDDLFSEVTAFEFEKRASRENDTDRIFRIWQASLKARSDFESGKANALKYAGKKVNGKQVTLTILDPPPPEFLGQERMIRVDNHYVSLSVVAFVADEVTLEVTFGDAASLPYRGLLEINTRRAKQAIERQRQALDAVYYKRSVNPGLKELILNPKVARAPLSGVKISDPGENFDDDKKAVLRKALGTQDLLVIEGPPGTGKTRVIEEIIIQFLDQNPHKRVLLSSQTHVALDNVIERIRKRAEFLDIVRVGRFDDPKIAKASSDLLLERKAEAWSNLISTRARSWLNQWATEHGVDPSDIEAGIICLQLARMIKNRLGTISAVQAEQTRAESAADFATSSGKSDSAYIALEDDPIDEEKDARLAESELSAELKSISDEEAILRKRLALFEGYKSELSKCEDPQVLEEYSQMFLHDGESQEICLQLMQLQENWLERVGKSTDFHAAMLASAHVVAATCVGLAGVRGMTDVSFDLCIVDEASKATATEVLVPLSRSRKAILVGDPRQLPPFFESGLLNNSSVAEFTEAELRENVFDRLLKFLPKENCGRLLHQYRMAKPIGDLVSSVFYGGALVSPKLKSEVTFPGYSKSVTWIDTGNLSHKNETKVGTSYQNEAECRIIRKVLQTIAFTASKRRGASYDIAVIAGYLGQVRALENAVRDHRHTWPELRIRINTVDAFQGSEAEVCIYSVVRSNERSDFGFLTEPPRLNVALSRARSLLAVVGDFDFCSSFSSSIPIADVIEYIKAHPQDCEVRLADDA